MSHWYTIFASLGEDFDPTRQYTLNDFQVYNIYEHSSIIFEICHDAMQQEKLREKVSSQKFFGMRIVPRTSIVCMYNQCIII